MSVSVEQSYATRVDSALCLLSAFAYLGLPTTMLDIGCGKGHLVKVASALGVDSRGVDISIDKDSDNSLLSYCDLTKPTGFDTYDMVLCLEVAEHIEREYASTLVESISTAIGTRSTLLFSAATPGQGGAGHVNEQPHDYWIDLFRGHGIIVKQDSTDHLRHQWSLLAPSAWWYGKNLMVMQCAI